MRMLDRVAATLAAGCILYGTLATGGAEAEVKRSGTVTKFQGVDEIIEVCTIKKTFVPIPKMNTTFNVSNNGSSGLVTFSASASLGPEDFDTGFVRLMIDNVVQSPGEVPFIGNNESGESNAFTWQTRVLSKGSHTARIEWRTDLNSSFCVTARSLIVQFR